ncbi:RNA-binding protein [Pseudoclavibacter sp. RFBJ3]|uniref:RNA-binding protein n=1 Tax=unclassified Pseudoclavibacter TaxID=2615177 RepID=UPI000CE7C4A9|nr:MULTISPECIES: RNA-binding protein [unclassified Pseudoclavibacter]MBF4550309.1 RNA-binding protein [Pseudoclavibacter sp. VKM Ac-2888]PPF82004.1 RNA-binding protein [Pseudoclavibacter sp. RFBJ5]PPF94754.1 RNA-binding protein [Pseudoclavibacter sp. RFBJ3]PPF95978.1 RNA-binding protein [Pseudoclavibacter sp. RFBH5]PPG21270.1 RNA-binding protein [Pseudoclavibacter sp. RFBI4]
MGLNIPEDLEAWQRWQNSRSLKRQIMTRVRRPSGEPEFTLMVNGPEPRLLVLIDVPTPSAVAAYAEPLRFLEGEQVAVLAPKDLSGMLDGSWTSRRLEGLDLPGELRGVRAVFAAGHFLPAGAVGYRWSRQLGARFVVAQHGLTTPFAPPLARGSHLLAFSQDDAEFWKSGRGDVTHEVVGAQLLWHASRRNRGRPEGPGDATPVFLGQLHGAELSRWTSARTARTFCTTTGAEYRPHPAETDRLSRLQHRAWQRRGVRFESSGQSLATLDRPVVSVFSTGVLEAAAAGQDAWVTCVDPPEWVRDFWTRYGLSQWGSDSTPAPPVPQTEPAQLIAASISRILEETV